MVDHPRTILVVTGSRADFGLLTPVMRAIQAHPNLRLQTAVAGAHWVAETSADITDAGFKVDEKIQMQTAGQTGRHADVQATARGIAAMGLVLSRRNPDAVLVLGDRIEAFAAAAAAAIGGIHLAHIHGGDRAEGVADESMRHAISKLAHLHFPATEQSAQRLIRMGEDGARIFQVGSPAIDGLENIQAASDAPFVVCAQHPIGADDAQEKQWMAQTLEALGDHRHMVLAPNADPGSEGIRDAICEAGIDPVEHLPRKSFLSQVAGARMMVGNSSAGLIEAAALKTPAVNIGPRQAGREKPNSVVDCDYGKSAIQAAMETAAQRDCQNMAHPYGDGHAGEAIADHLATIDLAAVPIRKQNTY